MNNPPTLRDVAERAGVSLGTASRALNNKNNVLAETRSRVLLAASELGYQLQFRVPSAISSKLNTIGVVVKRDPRDKAEIDAFNYGVLCGVEDACKQYGLDMMFSTIPVNDFSHAIDVSPILKNTTIDGLIIIGAILSDKCVCEQLPTDIPIVFVDGSALHGEYDEVLIDNFCGAYKIVSHLIEQGHTHIGLIGSSGTNEDHPSIQERRRGYLRALTAHGINTSYIAESSLQHHLARDATRVLLTENPQITAIFACIDLLAIEALSVIKALGRSVPQDISVAGFDDVDMTATAIPPITTMRVDRNLMGTLAVRRLYDRATHLDSVPIKTIVGTRLINRQSVIMRSQAEH